LCYVVKCSATNYYFSASSGDDSRTTAQVQNQATPWKTLNKLNSFVSQLKPGDSVLFKRGDIFFGSLKITSSGNSQLHIVFAAYGTGVKPVISGLQTLSGWTSAGKGIYSSPLIVNSAENIVLINNAPYPMGRYPDSGYINYSNPTQTSIVSSQPLPFNFTGATCVIRIAHWVIDRDSITYQSGNTIRFANSSPYTGINGYGFFVQNSLTTLSQFGEWYHNKTANNMQIYFGSNSPSNYIVQASTVDTLVNVKANYITFSDIKFSGANKVGVSVSSTSYPTFLHCKFLCCTNGIVAHETSYATITGCKFYKCLNDGIYISGITPTNDVVTYDTLLNIGYIPGMGGSGNDSYQAVINYSQSGVVSHCKIKKSGYTAIRFDGNGSRVDSNYIDGFCFVKDDGGGIYTGNGAGKTFSPVRYVRNNIVLNGIGAPGGTSDHAWNHGIYMDDNSNNVMISRNTIANVTNGGIFFHDGNGLTLRENTTYNCGAGFLFQEDIANGVRNITLRKNLFFVIDSPQLAYNLYYYGNDLNSVGTMDSNYLVSPYYHGNIIQYATNNVTHYYRNTFSGWQVSTTFDTHSYAAPVSVSDKSKIKFYYNQKLSTRKVALSGTFVNVDSILYSGTLVLKPYTSVILMKVLESGYKTDSASARKNSVFFLLDSKSVALKEKQNIIYQNFPNPFKNSTLITYQLANKAFVKIIVYNNLSEPLCVLENSLKNPGYYQIPWASENLPAGTYFYTVFVNNKATTKKMIKIK